MHLIQLHEYMCIEMSSSNVNTRNDEIYCQSEVAFIALTTAQFISSYPQLITQSQLNFNIILMAISGNISQNPCDCKMLNGKKQANAITIKASHQRNELFITTSTIDKHKCFHFLKYYFPFFASAHSLILFENHKTSAILFKLHREQSKIRRAY